MHWLLSDLQKLGGYYECPESSEGKLLGPLVGYAGRYHDAEGSSRQFVGKVYYNFAKGEQNAKFRQTCAYQLKQALMDHVLHLDCVIGLPMGGIMLAVELGNQFGCDTIFAEKKVTRLADGEQREQSELVIGRHDLKPGSQVILVEDVCNNFSTTAQAIKLVQNLGSAVVAIACAINRSPASCFGTLGNDWPVVGVVHQYTQEWKQDDPAVAEYIAAGQVVWKPKNDWPSLQTAMDQHQRG